MGPDPKDLGVSHACIFAGYTDRPAEIMRSAELVVLPTLYEGLSLTLLEAMHSGAAIVTTNASYQDRILEDGYHAGIVPCRNSDALADKVIAMLADESLRERCRQNVSELADYYSEHRMLADYSDMLEALIASSPKQYPQISPDAPEQNTHWITLQETADGSFTLSLANERPNTADPCRNSLSATDMALPATAVLGKARRIGIGFASSENWEIWLQPTHIVPMHQGNISLGAWILQTVCSNASHQSARALTMLKAVLMYWLSASDNGKITPADFAVVLQYQSAFKIPGQALLSLITHHSTDPDTRQHCLIEVGSILGETVSASLQNFLSHLPLSKREHALLKGHIAKAQGDHQEAQIYLTVADALNDTHTTKQAQPVVLFFAEYFNYPPLNGGDRRMLSLMQAYQKLGFTVHFCGLTGPRLASAKKTQTRFMQDNLGIEAVYIKISTDVEKKLKRAHVKITQGENAIDDFYDSSIFSKIRRLVATLQPNILHVNYCYFGWVGAAAEGMECHRVLDTHDLISRRIVLNRELLQLVGDKSPENMELIPIAAHNASRLAGLRYNLLQEELLQLQQFDTILMIAPDEALTLKSLMPTDTVRTLEMFSEYAPAQ